MMQQRACDEAKRVQPVDGQISGESSKSPRFQNKGSGFFGFSRWRGGVNDEKRF